MYLSIRYLSVLVNLFQKQIKSLDNIVSVPLHMALKTEQHKNLVITAANLT